MKRRYGKSCNNYSAKLRNSNSALVVGCGDGVGSLLCHRPQPRRPRPGRLAGQKDQGRRVQRQLVGVWSVEARLAAIVLGALEAGLSEVGGSWRRDLGVWRVGLGCGSYSVYSRMAPAPWWGEPSGFATRVGTAPRDNAELARGWCALRGCQGIGVVCELVGGGACLMHVFVHDSAGVVEIRVGRVLLGNILGTDAF